MRARLATAPMFTAPTLTAPTFIASVLVASVFTSSVCAACTPAAAAPWAPSLVVRGELVRAQGDATLEAPPRWDWMAGLELRWSPVPAPAAPQVGLAARRDRLAEPNSSCAHASLCAWERRSAARALGQWESTR